MNVFRRREGFQYLWQDSPVSVIIIALNTIMFLVTVLTGGFTSINLLDLGGLYPPLVTENGEWYRLITMMFLHGSTLHFISNILIGVIVLSTALERLIGSFKFSILYFGSGILGSIIILFLSPNALSIGASGAIYGVLGALLFITIYRDDLMSPRDVQSIRGLIIINIVFTFLAPSISIAGHLGGIVAGFLLSFILIRRNVFKVIS